MTVLLQFTPAYTRVQLRELTGRDELESIEPGCAGAIRLLERLLTAPDISGHAPTLIPVKNFVTADRDRLLAEVYKQNYGPRVNSILYCTACSERFELDFLIDNIITFLQAGDNDLSFNKDGNGTYRIDDHCSFRLPCGEDELTIVGLPVEEAVKTLLARCLLNGDPEKDGERVQKAMEQIAPVLHTTMAAICPECGVEQQLQFDVQSFLLSKIKIDQPLVLEDVHRLASAYRWSHQEILDLPRALRRAYATMIEAERAA